MKKMFVLMFTLFVGLNSVPVLKGEDCETGFHCKCPKGSSHGFCKSGHGIGYNPYHCRC